MSKKRADKGTNGHFSKNILVMIGYLLNAAVKSVESQLFSHCLPRAYILTAVIRTDSQTIFFKLASSDFWKKGSCCGCHL